MDDRYRLLLTSSASVVESSTVLLRRLEASGRALDHQVVQSRALIREARWLLNRFDPAAPADVNPCRVWRLHGHSSHPVDCTIQQIEPGTFRLVIARDASEIIAEVYCDYGAAAVRAQRLGRDLLDLGWMRGEALEA